MNFISRFSTLLCILSLCLLLPLPAQAHKLRIFAWSEGNIIHGETSFNGNGKPSNVTITVHNAANQKSLLTIQTDKQGKFSFPLPKEAVQNRLDLLLVVNSGDGHRGEWLLPATEYLDTAAQPPAKEKKTMLSADSPLSSAPSAVLTAQIPSIRMDEQLLRRIVDEELEKKIAPIRQMLAENSDKGPTLRDILGGIGFILGLAGLFAWLQSRKQDKVRTP